MKRTIWTLVLAVVLLSPTLPVVAESTADARLDFVKSLAGRWVAEGEELNGAFEFSVTAGGHAVQEREMIGTPMEMLTVYHMQGDQLIATHYCMLGNQPRLLAAKSKQKNHVEFECDGKPGNTQSHDEAHIHSWSMTLNRDGSLQI